MLECSPRRRRVFVAIAALMTIASVASCGASAVGLTCPPGTVEGGGRPPQAGASWCERTDHTREGPFVAWSSDGKRVLEGAYVDGEYDGIFRAFDENGHVLGTFEMKRGTGHWTSWHPNGVRAAEGDYVGGKRDGLWVQYHETGAKAFEGTYERGLETGVFKWYWPDGRPQAETPYERGRNHGVARTYDQRGELTEENEWVHGQRVRTTTFEGGRELTSEHFDLPERSTGPAVTRTHPKIPAEWQTCEADYDCEGLATTCCACGANDYVAVGFTHKEEGMKAVARDCEEVQCPAMHCSRLGVRCDDGRCVTTGD
ncbi:MAG: toxin-antitoxin system YwqK family antitoxin [Polyangiaceae bacterium]